MPRPSVIETVSMATTLIASAAAQNVISARPGTITYVEGQASLVGHAGGEDLRTRVAGTISLGAGEAVTTAEGRAELQLTPSAFLRVGQNSRVKMISPSLIHTAIEVQAGRAEIEVDQIFEQGDLRVDMGSGPAATHTQLVKPGIYEFDADAGVVRVYEGKAEVSGGSNSAQPVSVKGGHLLALTGDATKPQGFNKKKATDDLIAWADVRSRYVGQENAGLVQSAGGSYGYGNGFNSGPYDLGFGSYPWFPGTGFYSPFGLGLYSSFAGGPFGFGYSGFGYPGYGYGLFSGPGYGFGGLGYGGYGGGYGYAGVSGPGYGLGTRSGYTGKLGNRGQGLPGPGQGPVVGLHGATQTRSSSAAQVSQPASVGGPQGGSFHGGGSGGAAASHSSGGGSHR